MTAYADGILAELLRDAGLVTPAGSDSRVYTRQVPDLADRLPCLVVRALAGGSALQATGDGSRQVPWQLDSYGADTGDAGRAAHGRARLAVRVLMDAARDRTLTGDGYLLAVTSISGPYDAADAGTPGGVVRWQVTGLAAFRQPF